MPIGALERDRYTLHRVDRHANAVFGEQRSREAAHGDHNGIGPAFTSYNTDGSAATLDANKGVNRSALTLGLNYAFNLNTVFKLEYRYDFATGPIFLDTKTDTAKKNNQLLSTAVVVTCAARSEVHPAVGAGRAHAGAARSVRRRFEVCRAPRGVDLEFKPIELEVEGLMASCIQHELDHLNGILFIDHISRLKRDRVIKKFQKAEKLGKF